MGRVRVATLEEALRYGRPGLDRRGLKPPIGGGAVQAVKLVSGGAVSQGASGAAVTPAFGQTPTPGSLLVCWVVGTGSATLPAAPAGWTNTVQRAGTSCSASVFVKQAAVGETAPTIALVAGAVLSARLAEFSSITQTTVDRANGTSGIASPLVVTMGGADLTTGDLMVACGGAFYSAAAVKTLSNTLNNGAASTDTTNNGTSTVNHYCFGWGVTTGNSAADSDSFAYTTTSITGAAVVLASFRPLLAGFTVVGQAVQRAAVR